MLKWLLFYLLRGDEFLLFLYALLLGLKDSPVTSPVTPADPIDSTFIKDAEHMFPENFLSKYPQEADPFRLKIFGYLIFNLLVKGYASVDPSTFWSNYNRDDVYRAAIDAVFYEYLTNFTDREDKDLLFNPLEVIEGDISTPVSSEEIAVDRIGQYLDLLSENKSQPEITKGAYRILSKANESPAMTKQQTAEYDWLHSFAYLTEGIPGEDYPNFRDIPKTSFACTGKKVPGIYADYETGCQVFHVCWPRRMDSFLCPLGTIFNQSLWTCDIWHDTGCHSSPLFHHDLLLMEGVDAEVDFSKYDGSCESLLNKRLFNFMKFKPAKCEARDVLGRKLKPLLVGEDELGARLEITNNLIKEMLRLLTKLRSDLEKSRLIPGIHIPAKIFDNKIFRLSKFPEINFPDFSTENVEEATEFTRKLGETDFQPPETSEQVDHFGKLLSGTSSTLLKPSNLLEEHLRRSRKQDVPEIVMKSLNLGGTILNEGVIPLAKKIIMDSYRKIESKKQ